MLLTKVVAAGEVGQPVGECERYAAVKMEMEDDRGQGEAEERRLLTARNRGRDQSPLTELNSRYHRDEKVMVLSTVRESKKIA